MASNFLDDLSREPTSQEWERAERARTYQAVEVHSRYEVRDGVLQPAGDAASARTYLLAGATGLLKETADLNVEDAAGLTTFASRWGLLGYSDIAVTVDPSMMLYYYDPLVWIWAHVTGIRTVVDLHRLLRRRDEDALWDYLDRLRGLPGPAQDKAHLDLQQLMRTRRWAETCALIPALSERSKPPGSRFAVDVVFGRRHRVGGWTSYYLRDAPLAQVAWDIIRAILNPNLAGCWASLARAGQQVDPFAPPSTVLAFDSTLSAVYWHLKQLVTASRVGECEECRFPFVQTDGRQRFCPPTDVERSQGKRDSRCAMRWRKRHQRQGGER